MDSISPGEVTPFVATPAVLTGDALYASAAIDLSGGTPAAIDRGWHVALGDIDVADVTWTSPSELAITIPAGLAGGNYDVTAVSPTGDRTTLTDALVVDDVRVTAVPPAAGSEAVVVSTDAFGDGTPFGYVTGYLGRVTIGPNAGGSAALRMLPDGTSRDMLTFSIADDVTGHKAANNGTAPYTSLGFTGCAADVTCGPNNEDGRGTLTSATIGGAEWLIAAGARSSGNADYLYMTTAATTSLDFRYVDLWSFFGGSALDFSAIFVLDDIVYLGGVANNAQRPRLVTLQTTPGAPGLDADTAVATDLQIHAVPGIQASAIEKIDAIGAFGGLLYLANAGAWLRATQTAPGPYPSSGGEWALITPSAPAYAAHPSRTSSKTRDLEPIDRAVPQMAAFGGRMFVGRNTVAGPQLWSCDPTASGDPQQCDAADWALVAPDALGASSLTQFDDGSLTSITMVVATATHLYIGFDSTAGVTVFRTGNPAATTRADFVGTNGCSAALHGNGTCAGYGTPGLGAGLTRIFDAKALFGSVWITAGTGLGPLALVKLP